MYVLRVGPRERFKIRYVTPRMTEASVRVDIEDGRRASVIVLTQEGMDAFERGDGRVSTIMHERDATQLRGEFVPVAKRPWYLVVVNREACDLAFFVEVAW